MIIFYLLLPLLWEELVLSLSGCLVVVNRALSVAVVVAVGVVAVVRGISVGVIRVAVLK